MLDLSRTSGDAVSMPVDLAPEIHRQRLVVEGLVDHCISDEEIVTYLKSLGPLLDMVVLNEPVTHESPLYGWAAWVHWETSGAHFYAWDRPKLFFSADIYTCKPFQPLDAVRFTRDHFNAYEVVYREF